MGVYLRTLFPNFQALILEQNSFFFTIFISNFHALLLDGFESVQQQKRCQNCNFSNYIVYIHKDIEKPIYQSIGSS